MVTGQLTRSEAESALRRLEGLRSDWEKQRKRWSEHYQQALNIQSLQRNPSAPLSYTVEACCNQVGIATIRFNELERLIQDFRACALYLVHLPIPEGPDASFRSALPDLWSIPHSAPGVAAVALPGQVAGFSAQVVPLNTIQGLSDQILTANTPGMSLQPSHQQPLLNYSNNPLAQLQAFNPNQSFAMSPNPTGQFQSQPSSAYNQGNQFQQPMLSSFPTNSLNSGYSSQPLPPQHTQSIYNQQMSQLQQQQQQPQPMQQPFPPQQFNSNFSQSRQVNPSPLNPYNPNPPHGAVLDASQRYPAVQ